MKPMNLFRPIHCMSATVVLILSALLVSTCAFAQTETAAVSGRVTDSSGAVIVGAEVEIRNVDTNSSQVIGTNSDGFYSLPSLKPGNYVMSVRKQSFRTVSVTGLLLSVQERLSRNFTLQVGSTVESITVRAETTPVNTTDASVGAVVDQSYVANMPLNGRSFQDLILLTPGAVTQTPQNTGVLGGTGEFSVNGQRTESNYYTVDGVSANVGTASGAGNAAWNLVSAGASGSTAASTALGTTQALVSVDALQEFRVQSSNYSAEYGRNPGGQFAFETKSGTNQWHGSVYDYLRNGSLDAQDWFNDFLNTPNKGTRQNDFGGTFGGAIRKDKTFFFGSYEGLRLRQVQPATNNTFVPDSAMRAAAPAALQPVMKAFPSPTPGGFDDTAVTNTAQYLGSWTNPSSINSVSVRVDQNVGDKARLFFRFNNATSNQLLRPAVSPSDGNNLDSTVRTYTAGATIFLSPRVSNEFRLNYSSNESASSAFVSPIGDSQPLDLLAAGAMPATGDVNLCIVQKSFNSTCIEQGAWSNLQRQWNVVDTVSFTAGNHQLKFGADFRRLSPNSIQATPDAGYSFFGLAAIQANSSFASLSQHNQGYPLYKNFSAFVNDQWRVLPRLTLNLGLRWEVNPAPGVTQGLEPFTVQGPTLETMVAQPQGTPLWNTTWGNFAPRLGVAYTLRDQQGWETVLRGGVGVFFDTGQQDGSLAYNGPGFYAFNFNPAGAYPFDGSAPGTFPTILDPCATQGCPGPYVNAFQVYSYYPHLQLPYTLHWNFNVEQALGKSQSLTVTYLGEHGSRLLAVNHWDVPNNPNVTDLFVIQNALTSDYDALQAQFQRRLARGLTGLASYTWSHCLDYGTGASDHQWQRGNCDLDIRHNFSGAFSWNLPNIGGSGIAKALLNHWGLDTRFAARTSFPITIFGNSFVGSDGRHYNAGVDFAPGVATGQIPIYLFGAACAQAFQAVLPAGQGCPGGAAINPSAFQDVTMPGQLGTAPRNFARLFGMWEMDMAVRREFPLSDRLKLQFRAEAFNIFNHPNFGSIDPFFGDSQFGLYTGTLATSFNTENALYQLGANRSMQFALKLVF